MDEVADPSFIVNNKKVLQAHVDGALLGQSATQMFVYEVFLWRTPIILTTNNWNLSGLAEDELEWINANCVVVHIAEPVYAHSSETRRLCRPHLGLSSHRFHQWRTRVWQQMHDSSRSSRSSRRSSSSHCSSWSHSSHAIFCSQYLQDHGADMPASDQQQPRANVRDRHKLQCAYTTRVERHLPSRG